MPNTPVAAASGERSFARSAVAWVTAGRRYPIGLALGVWGGAFGLVLSGYIPEGLSGICFYVVLAAFVLAWRLASRSRTADERRDLGYGRSSWLGVGALPLAYVGLALDRGSVLVHGVIGVLVLAVVVAFGVGLLSDSAGHMVTALTQSPLMEAIAVRASPTSSAEQISARSTRRRRIEGVDSLLTFIAFAIFAFSSVLAFLAAYGYGVHATPARLHGAEAERAAFLFVTWHLADLVPFLDAPHTVHWRLHHDFTDHYSGALLLSLKIFVAFPILRTAVKVWRASAEP